MPKNIGKGGPKFPWGGTQNFFDGGDRASSPGGVDGAPLSL